MSLPLPVSPAGRRYGARRPKPDPRDLGFPPFMAMAPRLLPAKFSNGPKCGPVKDQGDLGACTAFSGTGMMEFLFRRWQPTPKNVVFSPLFMYYLERQKNGDVDQGDTGSDGRTSVEVMSQYGVCLESTDPYSIANFNVHPTIKQIQEATLYRAGAYHALHNVMDMKSCLASEYIFTAGFNVFDSFESDATAKSGLMSVPDQKKEQCLGGHQVLFIGYDDNINCPNSSIKGAFQVRNSWSADWGLNGNFWFPYECVIDSTIFCDAYTQHFGKPW